MHRVSLELHQQFVYNGAIIRSSWEKRTIFVCTKLKTILRCQNHLQGANCPSCERCGKRIDILQIIFGQVKAFLPFLYVYLLLTYWTIDTDASREEERETLFI